MCVTGTTGAGWGGGLDAAVTGGGTAQEIAEHPGTHGLLSPDLGGRLR